MLGMQLRMSQSACTKAVYAFRMGKNVIMFSSDLLTWGIDYPDVLLILKVYLHTFGLLRGDRTREALLERFLG